MLHIVGISSQSEDSENRAFLEELGQREEDMTVLFAQTIQEAEEIAENFEPECLIACDNFASGKGLERVVALSRRFGGIPLLVLGGSDDAAQVREALSLGAFDYMTAPCNPERLDNALNAAKQFFAALRLGYLNLTQDEIDTLFRLRGSRMRFDKTPQGVRRATIEQMLRFFAVRRDPVSARQVSSAIDVSGPTAWRHLQYLVCEGVLEETTSGRTHGRPAKHYRLARPDDWMSGDFGVFCPFAPRQISQLSPLLALKETSPRISRAITVARIRQPLQSLGNLCGIALSLHDIDGTPVFPRKAPLACERFPLANERFREKCLKRIVLVPEKFEKRTHFTATCPFALHFSCTPISLNDERIALLDAGPFLPEETSREQLRETAARFHFDENAYLEACATLPRLSRSRLQNLLVAATTIISLFTEADPKKNTDSI